jgi:hypothetical protein
MEWIALRLYDIAELAYKTAVMSLGATYARTYESV